jgi:hypothetical protein
MLIKRKRKIDYIPVKKSQRSSNKVKGININAPGEVVYADITYLKTKNRHYFLALVVDTHVKY